jgi:rRNA methylase
MNTTSVDKAADTAVVLCRVKESGNVGSICRAMKTMGFTKLVLSNCPDYDEALVRTMAVHASDIFENAQRYADLEDALSAYSLSAGFTRRSGARRKAASISARDFARGAAGLPVPDAPFIQRNQSIAMVFGNERDGLSDHELSLCSLAVHIPSSDKFPSLNVAQAVQVACYEFLPAVSRRETSGRNRKSRQRKARLPPRQWNIFSGKIKRRRRQNIRTKVRTKAMRFPASVSSSESMKSSGLSPKEEPLSKAMIVFYAAFCGTSAKGRALDDMSWSTFAKSFLKPLPLVRNRKG